ncbi:serine/arginine repetitive matrix protein 1-like [Pollicipes pollicipes]|uniref:serine/arginine repetitive matrix protein 1-like n=1 Tax=Pollicipes pollicipes TaxID=41117 RepID=UPI0018859B37|nr:serine/arginine repetitive matrix protein 1-like [Pollicipes pollicipes]
MFADGLWAGVELARPIGKNDGSVGGRRYFFCQRGHGLFAPAEMVERFDPSPPVPTATPAPVPTDAGERLTNVSDGVDDELLQDIELDEVSFGILTPDQMEVDTQLMLRSEDLSRSLDMLASPSAVPPSPADLNHTFVVEAEQAAARRGRGSPAGDEARLVRMASDSGGALNITVTLNTEPDWEDEFAALSAPELPAQEKLPAQETERPERPEQGHPSRQRTETAEAAEAAADATFSLTDGDGALLQLEPQEDQPLLEKRASQEREQLPGEGREPVEQPKPEEPEEQQEVADEKEQRKDATGPDRKSVVFSEPETQRPDPATSCAISTTSIDGGYQGDSEFDTGTPSEDPARPPPRLDVLTDSDFCSEGAAGTESEAEHRLTDDMESSGVYSDAESRRSAEPDREPIEAIAETEETTLSPVLETPAEEQSSPAGAAAPALPASPTPSGAAAAPEQPVARRRRDPIPSHVVRARELPVKKDPIKMNHPLPRRNVQSKLRSMLEAPTPAPEGRRQQRAQPKGRWDAVMSRIEQNKNEEKTRPRREVKSRLYEGVTPAKGTQNGSRRSLVSGRNSRTGSTHTLTGSRTSLRPAGSRSVSPTLSEVSSASSTSARSHGSMNSADSSSKAPRPARSGSIPSLGPEKAGSAPSTARSGSKQPAAVSRPVPTTAARAALDTPARRHPGVLANKTNLASNHSQGTKTTKPPTRTPNSSRSQNKVQSKTATKGEWPPPAPRAS